MKVRGVVKGKTIVLDENPDLEDGEKVEVEIRAIEESSLEKYGFKPIIPAGGRPVTNELVNEIREELGI